MLARRFSEEQAAKYIFQLVSALRHCHMYNIIHRDIKPENLLLGTGVRSLLVRTHGQLRGSRRGAESAKAGGLWVGGEQPRGIYHSPVRARACGACGVCVSLLTCTARHKRETLCGTLDYLPPEMIEVRARVVRGGRSCLLRSRLTMQGQAYDERVDNWTVGVLAYEFLVGRPPFEAPVSPRVGAPNSKRARDD